jgi:hypothetical protein
MKKLIVALLLVSAFTAGCTRVSDTNENQNNTQATLTEFQQTATDQLAAKALTEDDVMVVAPSDSVSIKKSTGRTGEGGVEITLVRNGEDVIKITYFTFQSKGDLTSNYTALENSAVEPETLSFVDNGYYDNSLMKAVIMTDNVKIDVRGTASEKNEISKDELLELAEAAFNKLTK